MPSIEDSEQSSSGLSRRVVLAGVSVSALLAMLGAEGIVAPAAGAAVYVKYRRPFATIGGGRDAVKGGHNATDFGLPNMAGLAIPAAAAGVVTRTGINNHGMGNRIELLHADGVYSGYCHMASAPTLGVNDVVNLGDTLGFVGGTNGSPNPYSPHLHLAMSLEANKTLEGEGGYSSCFDPLPYIDLRTADPEVRLGDVALIIKNSSTGQHALVSPYDFELVTPAQATEEFHAGSPGATVAPAEFTNIQTRTIARREAFLTAIAAKVNGV